MMADGLSESQQEMLLRLFEGDYPRACIDGNFWADDPGERVDGRTMQSLVARGLVYITTGVSSGMTSQGVWLTEQGKEIAKELDEAAYQKRQARRGW